MTMVDESQVADPTVFYNLGVNYYNAQDMDNAIKYFEKSVQVDPKFADGYYQLALVYLAKGNNAKTIEYFNKVIEIDPNSDMAKEAQDYIKTMGQ
jgi:tetratricopeptide (TPR) repeat protein